MGGGRNVQGGGGVGRGRKETREKGRKGKLLKNGTIRVRKKKRTRDWDKRGKLSQNKKKKKWGGKKKNERAVGGPRQDAKKQRCFARSVGLTKMQGEGDGVLEGGVKN